jgi:hypothetical protein
MSYSKVLPLNFLGRAEEPRITPVGIVVSRHRFKQVVSRTEIKSFTASSNTLGDTERGTLDKRSSLGTTLTLKTPN